MTTQPGEGSTAANRPESDDTTEYLRPDTTRDSSIPVTERYVEPGHSEVRQQRVVHEQTPQPYYAGGSSTPVNVAVGAERKDGVRWGPVWAGLLTALTTFILLELLFFAAGWLDLDFGQNISNSTSRGVITGILALLAFLLGGLVAGATAIWKGLFSGLLHGFLVWALGVAAALAIAFFGGGALLGSVGSLTNQLGIGNHDIRSATHINNREADRIANKAQDAAWPAFLGLALPLGAALLGGLVGSKVWPRRDMSDPERVRLDD